VFFIWVSAETVCLTFIFIIFTEKIMSKKSSLKPLAAAVGTAVIASLAAVPVAQADASPFGMTDLGSGYQVAAEGKCGESKAKEAAKEAEGKCGESKAKEAAKEAEGKCGESKAKEAAKETEGKCGASK
jgi:uncharacterized low-complexity protein